MQFPSRIGTLIIAFLLLILLYSLWRARSREEDQETRILELISGIETHVSEYESAIRAFRAELLLVKEGSLRPFFLTSNGSNSSNGSQDGPGGLQDSGPFSQPRLRSINIYSGLPHLLEYEDALTPALVVGKGRDGVSLVIGIPTVRRPTQSYLLLTLQNLINAMSPSEKNETLIIVFVAEPDVTFVRSTVNDIREQLQGDVDSGLVEILAPSPNFYPDFKVMKGTLGDSEDRTRWRTKQNLDYVYMMLYAQYRGTYYVQLEDDVLTRRGFVTTMTKFALQKTVQSKDWFMLDFCQLGFIGKLFRSSDLWRLSEFLLLFYQDKPGDWLLSHFFTVKYCKIDFTHKKCLKVLTKHWIHYKPSLFQHIGMVSSLSGKVQKLKDRQFGKLELFTGHGNPPAKVESTIRNYGKFSLQKAYEGRSYFWGLSPRKGDFLRFMFNPPVSLKSFKIFSGNVEHPSDKLRNATLELVPLKDPPLKTGNKSRILLNEVNERGELEGRVPPSMNPVKMIQINVKSPSENWILISEIFFEPVS